MPYSHPTAIAIRESLSQCMDDGNWRSYDGQYCKALRDSLSVYFSRNYARLCCSGTFGIELALRSLRLKPNAEVIIAGYDFPGNVRAVMDAGLNAVVCDVGYDGWVPNVDQLSQAFSSDTRAVVVSHLHGMLAPMDSICVWARDRGLFVIEDACQEPGALFRDHSAEAKMTSSSNPNRVGSWGDLSVLSFGGSKLLSAGRGGAVLTNDPLLAQRMTIFCERGNDAFALSDIQAALLLPQIRYLNDDNQRRNSAASKLLMCLNEFSWLKPVMRENSALTAYYKLGLMVSELALKTNAVQKCIAQLSSSSHADDVNEWLLARDCIIDLCQLQGLRVGPGFRSIASMRRSQIRHATKTKQSLQVANTTLVLHHDHLLHPETGFCDIDQVIASLKVVDERLNT